MRLNRTPSLHDRKWRNKENDNWIKLEDAYNGFDSLYEFLESFDGKQLLEKSYNIFNKNTVVLGELSNQTGEVLDGTYWVSDYIKVRPGEVIQVKPLRGQTAMYDSSLNYIGNIPSGNDPYPLPNNALYIRTQMSKESLNGKYVYHGAENLPYKSYGFEYLDGFDDLVREITKQMIPTGNVEEYVNLFDKSKVQTGELDDKGNIIAGTFRITDYIEIIPGREVKLKPGEGRLSVYDDDFNFIKNIESGETPKKMPWNARYIRNQMSVGSVQGKYIYIGEEHMEYYPYKEGPYQDDENRIKILGLGNSYSNDTFWMLKDIAESAGYKVTVGISHLSGGTLEQVYDAINGNGTVTTYNKFTANGLNARTNFNAKDIITDEDWDYIFIQQASTSAMDYATYQPALGNLVSYLKANATNSSVKLGINMPWVRPISNATIGTAEKQLQVNAAIVDACQQAMFNESLDIFIPTGIAIMNGRSNDYLAQVSDELTRDGSHLDEGIGRYLAALTAFNAIFGEVADGNITYSPGGTNNFYSYLSKISAKKAVIQPFEVTKV